LLNKITDLAGSDGELYIVVCADPLSAELVWTTDCTVCTDSTDGTF